MSLIKNYINGNHVSVSKNDLPVHDLLLETKLVKSFYLMSKILKLQLKVQKKVLAIGPIQHH